MATFSYSLTDSKIETGTVTRTRDISELYECVSITPCVDCSVCPLYVLPFFETDTFAYTLDFRITLVELLNLDGTLIQTQNSWANGSLLTVNFSDITEINCFRIRLNGECCFEFSYERITEDCHKNNSLLIWSEYDNVDCLGNRYPAFSNKVRIYAYINHISDTSEVEEKDGKVVSEKLREVYLLEFNRGDRGLVPDTYFSALFRRATMRGSIIYVETAENTYIFDKFTDSIERGTDATKNWYPKIRLETLPCELDFICS